MSHEEQPSHEPAFGTTPITDEALHTWIENGKGRGEPSYSAPNELPASEVDKVVAGLEFEPKDSALEAGLEWMDDKHSVKIPNEIGEAKKSSKEEETTEKKERVATYIADMHPADPEAAPNYEDERQKRIEEATAARQHTIDEANAARQIRIEEATAARQRTIEEATAARQRTIDEATSARVHLLAEAEAARQLRS